MIAVVLMDVVSRLILCCRVLRFTCSKYQYSFIFVVIGESFPHPQNFCSLKKKKKKDALHHGDTKNFQDVKEKLIGFK